MLVSSPFKPPRLFTILEAPTTPIGIKINGYNNPKSNGPINGINIVTDVIVGYPTETEEDFLETYNLIKILKFDVLNISKFTSHKQTEAFRLKQLRSEVIKERSKRLSIL